MLRVGVANNPRQLLSCSVNILLAGKTNQQVKHGLNYLDLFCSMLAGCFQGFETFFLKMGLNVTQVKQDARKQDRTLAEIRSWSLGTDNGLRKGVIPDVKSLLTGNKSRNKHVF